MAGKSPGANTTRIDYDAEHQTINTNLISQQLIEPRDNPPVAHVPYSLPYLFQRELKKPDGTPVWPEFKRVLIIGAGNGNDVACPCIHVPQR